MVREELETTRNEEEERSSDPSTLTETLPSVRFN